jgi:polyhydroxyalkanoate synthase
LREFYLHNKLAKGSLKIGGVTLDLGNIAIPVYHLATREDHIAPAESVFIGAKLFGGPLRFVLASSGHIAGVVNPPAKVKYAHWLPGRWNPKLVPSIEAFIEKAKEVPGSWWPDHSSWLAKQSGARVKPRIPGEGPYKAIEDAPGSYVLG